jgi:glucose/arabinose dehydrogenase
MHRPTVPVFAPIVLGLVVLACDGAAEPSTSVTAPATTEPTATTTTLAPATTTTLAPTTTTSLPPLSSLAYEPVVSLDFPVQLIPRPGSELSYIATRAGRIWLFDGEALGDTPVLDITDRVRSGGEQGLLSIVLHPEDLDRLFVHYSDVDGDTVVAEFAMISEVEADPDGERALLGVDQPASNHNGGMIQFMPDGRLLLGLGDGGGGGDRYGNAQNRDTLLGGLVAVSVDGDPSPVLYSFGLRNPWRFWIDGETLYVADVGQDAYEEINVTPLAPDLNYGWPITEGLHCFRPAEGCDTSGLTLPLLEVAHGDAGTCSISGGLVYRGEAIPEIEGHYFYSDYCGGYLRSFRHEDGEALDQTDWTEQVGVAGKVTGFGLDPAGEIYVMTADGAVLRVVPVR